jgi:hypothetical protein
VGGRDLKATFLVTTDTVMLFVLLRMIVAGGSMAGRTGSTPSGREATLSRAVKG